MKFVFCSYEKIKTYPSVYKPLPPTFGMDGKEVPNSVVPTGRTKPKRSAHLDPSSLLTLPKGTVRIVMNQETELRISKDAVNLTSLYAEDFIRDLTHKAAAFSKSRRCRTILEEDINTAIDF